MKQVYRVVIIILMLTFSSNLAQSSITNQYISVQYADQHKLVLTCDFTNAYQLFDTTISGKKFTYFGLGISSGRNPGEPWLPQEFIPVAVPNMELPEIFITGTEHEEIPNVFIPPYPEKEGQIAVTPANFSQKVYQTDAPFPSGIAAWMQATTARYLTIRQLAVSPFMFNPVKRILTRYKKLTITIHFKSSATESITDVLTESLISSVVINPLQARQFLHKAAPKLTTNRPSVNSWYNPNASYLKVFFSKAGIYRVDHQFLSANGVQAIGKSFSQLALYINQQIVPVQVSDKNNNGLFDQEDYFTFVGTPPPASIYCTQNIYQTANVGFVTFLATDTSGGRYIVKSSNGTTGLTKQQFNRTDFYEKDQVFERLGHAPDPRRDFWFWGSASVMNYQQSSKFLVDINPLSRMHPDSHIVRYTVKLHGMTNYNCDYDHHAVIKINNRKIGEARWNGQTEYTHSGSFYVSVDSIPLLPTGNTFEVIADGFTCRPADGDEFRINYFSLSYPALLQAENQKLQFADKRDGEVLFSVSGWQNDSILIMNPAKGLLYTTKAFNNGTLTFIDANPDSTPYYLSSITSLLTPDSAQPDITSNLQSSANGADYLIIAHRQFSAIAERLKTLRATHFPDKTIPQPRITIVYTDDIYDEFSGGLMDADAIKQFISYAFSNWQSPAPAYAVLIGDMSFDYRRLLPDSRPNFIPSPNVMSYTYGIAASDNEYACISGEDVHPELALGRISIETIAEGNTFLNKLETYPGDTGKAWKNNIMFFASGMNAIDEDNYGFNAESYSLKQGYADNFGATSKVIFRYPNNSLFQQFQGSTAEMRNAISDGGVLLNYYGHGGGFQWDLVFTENDIYLLNNQNRLPLVLSVTCYTGHFDNYNIFGEQFNKVAGKGSIGFFGSSGLTNWESGKYINNFIFDELFTQKNYITGKVFMKAKMRTPVNSWYGSQISLLTYLGDPVLSLALPENPDYNITQDNVQFGSNNLFKGDSLTLTIKLKNYGLFQPDSVHILVQASNGLKTSTIFNQINSGFAREKLLQLHWKTDLGGNVQISTQVVSYKNLDRDTLDNRVSKSLSIADVDEPNVIFPLNGYQQSNPTMQFILAAQTNESGNTYTSAVQIAKSNDFTNIIHAKENIPSINGASTCVVEGLTAGNYLWRCRLSNGGIVGRWSEPMVFSIGNDSNYSISGIGLQSLIMQNVTWDSLSNSLRFLGENKKKGSITTGILGPLQSWKSINFSINNDAALQISNTVLGYHPILQRWDTLFTGNQNNYNFNSSHTDYTKLQTITTITPPDTIAVYTSSFSGLSYKGSIIPDVRINPTTTSIDNPAPIPGSKFTGNLSVENLSTVAADSIIISGSLNGATPIIIGYSGKLEKQGKISIPFSYQLPNSIKTATVSTMLITASTLPGDLFSFNNSYTYNFTVSADSIKPEFTLFFDNNQIANGDAVAVTPEIKLMINDNSPVPIPVENINISYDLIPLTLNSDSVTVTPNPVDNGLQIIWKPKLTKGKHLMMVRIKDAAGNFFPDSASRNYYFSVYDKDDIVEVYNYPNPFASGTAFCFTIQGTQKPKEVLFKIFSITGRLLKEFTYPENQLSFNFNHVAWDGHDADGDAIANGTYLYKIIAKYPEKAIIKYGKLVKMQ